ncbi:MAG: type 4a pilus biogenesis protein PilO [Deltaproteobacteria bacterium]|nr:type 4a pilus biogenesis protein PilO [Deltaproteobacteria bacterium]
MDISLDELKKLPPKVKALIIFLACLLISYFYYMFFLQAALEKRMTLGDKLANLQQQVEEKEKAAAQLGRYIREVEALQESFQLALMKLPNEREIAGILSSVVLAGKTAGVDFLLFEPKPPEKAPPKPDAKAGAAKTADAKAAPKQEAEKFYDEIPIKVQVAGSFHNTVSFFDQVARLPRIVNIEDISMGEAQDVKGRGRIVKTSCTVKTYMFVDKK